MKLAIYSCGTEGYTYAMIAQARCVQSMVSSCNADLELLILVVGDGNSDNSDTVQEYKNLLPSAQVELLIHHDASAGEKNYDHDTQLLIARLRTMATRRAITWGADYCLSLDSDVLPPSNALRCMFDVLNFDSGYYKVAACPYPSQGGGFFLCGRGTPERHILPCFYEDEKEVPKELLEKRKKLVKKFDDRVAKELVPTKKMLDDREKLEKQIEAVTPKENVFALNGVKWRRRGWFDNAYPAIGVGAVVPTDWCGFGCTLMSKEALLLCDWAGYHGAGTEDLYIVWTRWYPRGIKIAAIPHCPCDHIIRSLSDKKKLIHLATSHVTEGECIGHLRQTAKPWYAQSIGEKHTDENDGYIY